MSEANLKVLISGGGTGGHIFPALAIAKALEMEAPGVAFLFVGAEGKMEMEKVPKAGYQIEGLWISGLQRKLTLRNALFPLKLASSLVKAWQIIQRFKPDVVVGTGGFASGPVLEVAARKGIPSLIQEQNAYAGLTNKILAKKVDKICVAYPAMEKYFPAEKLLLTGNPVRPDLENNSLSPEEGREKYGLDSHKSTLVLTGGSLGASQLNKAIAASADLMATNPQVQLLWQCGKLYIEQYQDSNVAKLPNVKLLAFLDDMEAAYAAADLMICRAGASSIAEICLQSKASILVPSPNVAEDHQTKNAKALADRNAAVLVKDADAMEGLLPTALALLEDKAQLKTLGENAKTMAEPGAAKKIAKAILELSKKKLHEA